MVKQLRTTARPFDCWSGFVSCMYLTFQTDLRILFLSNPRDLLVMQHALICFVKDEFAILACVTSPAYNNIVCVTFRYTTLLSEIYAICTNDIHSTEGPMTGLMMMMMMCACVHIPLMFRYIVKAHEMSWNEPGGKRQLY